MAKHLIDRGTRTALALLVTAAIAGSAAAQNAPATPKPAANAGPKAAPKAKDAGAQSNADKGPATTGATQAPPEPVIPDPRRNVPANIFQTFDANQKAQAAKVRAYLSSLQTLVGNFVQVGPDGSRTKGDFYIQKPGKVRFEYDEPSTIDDDCRWLVGRGARQQARDPGHLSAVADAAALSAVGPHRSDAGHQRRQRHCRRLFISITIEEKQALVGTSRLMLMIGAKDNQLKQWTVTDPQGYDTTVAVYNLDATRSPIPACSRSTSPIIRPSPG